MSAISLSERLRWRWTPFVSLVAGSLLYIAVVLLFVPNTTESPPTRSFTTGYGPSSLSAALGSEAAEGKEGNEAEASDSVRRNAPSIPTIARPFPRRGFSPVQRPDPPPPAPPPIPPAPVPAAPPPPVASAAAAVPAAGAALSPRTQAAVLDSRELATAAAERLARARQGLIPVQKRNVGEAAGEEVDEREADESDEGEAASNAPQGPAGQGDEPAVEEQPASD